MAQSQPDPLGQGIQAGRARLERYGLATDRDGFGPEIDRAMTITNRLLQQPETEASPRFVALFGEIVTVAVGARLSYADAPLSEDDIHQYLLHSFNFLNSFRHA
jgi:hypothetical protein